MEQVRKAVASIEGPQEALAKIEPLILSSSGRVVKTTGNLILATFEDAPSTARMAKEALKAFPDSVRMGLAFGPVTVTPNDVFGEIVNLAVRLGGSAENGQACATEAFVTAAASSRVPSRLSGERQFQGISSPIRVFILGNDPDELPKPRPVARKPKPSVSPDYSSQKPSELFDFSRAEHERMQEQEALSNPSEIESRISDSVIPLAEEAEPFESFAQKTKVTSLPPLRYSANKSMTYYRWAIGLFVGLSLVVPALLLTTGKLLYTAEVTEKKKLEDVMSRKLTESEVLQSMSAPRRNQITGEATLTIRTAPPNAEVYIDGNLVASSTPARLKNIPAGIPLRVRVEKPGYMDSTYVLNVDPNEQKELNVVLQERN